LINIEKDQSDSLVISATNMPESLDKALFRRFDDIIEYPLPGIEEIKTLLQKNLAGFDLSSNTSIENIAQGAKGLSYSEIVRACEESIKEMIIHNKKNITASGLTNNLKQRKQ
jgi:AAA+ superfamily predicted ATPase